MDDTRIFRFGPYELDERLWELRRDGERVPLQKRPLALLAYLLRHADRVVAHPELFQHVWPDAHVEETALKTAIRALRRALDDPAEDPRWISNVRGRGYRFHGALDVSGAPAPLPAAAAQAAATRSAAALRGSDFVGRAQLMDSLRASLERGGGVVLLHGPSGVGKTRTALQLADEAQSLGLEVHVGRTDEGEGAPPFWPWIQILRGWLTRCAPAERAEVAAGFAELAVLVPEELPGSSAAAAVRALDAEMPQQARFRLFDALRRLLTGSADRRPCLLILDDLHWADEDSLAFLLFLARSGPPSRGLILGTHREQIEGSARERWLASIMREHSTESIALRGLERGSVEQILRERIGPSLEPAIAERVFDASGGNPLFVLELAKSLAAHGEDWRSAPTTVPVPARLLDVVWARVRECSDPCQQLLRAMSVAGAGVRLAILRRVLEFDGATLLAAVSEAERADFVALETETVRFTHGVVRDAICAALAPHRRMQLHCAIGEALEVASAPARGAALAEIAYHFTESAALTHAARALDYARRAADAAQTVCAYADAAAMFRRALHSLEFQDAPEPELHCSLLVALGEMLGYSGEPLEDLQRTFAQALELAHAHGLTRAWAHAAERYVAHLSTRGSLVGGVYSPEPGIEQLRGSLEAVLPKLGGALDAEIRCKVLFALSILHAAVSDHDRARVLLQDVLRLSEESGNLALRAEALLHGWEIGLLFDRTEERAALPEVLRRCARESHRLDLEVRAHHLEITLCVERGDRAGAEELGRDLERLAETGSLDAKSCLRAWELLRAQLDGDFARVEVELRNVVRLNALNHLPSEWVGAVGGLHVWWTSLVRGLRASDLPKRIEAHLAAVPRPLAKRLFLARLYAAEGEGSERAREELEGLEEMLQSIPSGEQWIFYAGVAAEICALVGDRPRGAWLFERLLPHADRVMVPGLMICTGSVARPLGLLAALLGHFDEVPDLFARALAHARALRAPVLETMVELDHASALLQRGRAADRRQMDSLLQSVQVRAKKLQLDGLLERARQLASSARP